MTDLPPTSTGDALGASAAEASSAFGGLQDSAKAAADAIDQAFTRAGESVVTSLAKAAADGKVSLADLASTVIGALDAFARSSSGSGGGSITDALSSAITSAFAGARADGGAVAAGGSYLVGERGPELFRPAASGDVAPLGGGGVTVNVTVPGGGPAGLLRSEAQTASALARAVAVGVR